MWGDKRTPGATVHDASDAPAGAHALINRSRPGPLTVAVWVIAVSLAAIAVMLGVRLFLPGGSQPVLVQFSDLSGRVQLEFCPSLPASFEAIVFTDDLHADSAIIPVKVSGAVCGEPQYDDGVWIYLHRASVTLASTSSP